VQNDSDVKHRGVKKEASGFAVGKHNGVMGHYNICANPKLCVGVVVVVV
jgi:hypothetical protein